MVVMGVKFSFGDQNQFLEAGFRSVSAAKLDVLT